jgi:hypothetical protein
MINVNAISQAIINGLSASSTGSSSTDCRGGCGASYVCISSSVDRKTLNLIKKSVSQCGLGYLNKAYGVGNRAIYIGYDNADGRALAQAEAIALNLRALGIDCYDIK